MRGRRSLLNLKAQIVELRKSTSKSKEDQALLTKLVGQYRAELAKSKAAKAKADAAATTTSTTAAPRLSTAVQAKLTALKSEKEQLTADGAAMRAQLNELEHEVSQLNADLSAQRDAHDAVVAQVATGEYETDVGQRLQRVMQEKIELESDCEALLAGVVNAQQGLVQSAEALDGLQRSRADDERRVATLEATNASLRRDFERAASEHDTQRASFLERTEALTLDVGTLIDEGAAQAARSRELREQLSAMQEVHDAEIGMQSKRFATASEEMESALTMAREEQELREAEMERESAEQAAAFAAEAALLKRLHVEADRAAAAKHAAIAEMEVRHAEQLDLVQNEHAVEIATSTASLHALSERHEEAVSEHAEEIATSTASLHALTERHEEAVASLEDASGALDELRKTPTTSHVLSAEHETMLTTMRNEHAAALEETRREHAAAIAGHARSADVLVKDHAAAVTEAVATAAEKSATEHKEAHAAALERVRDEHTATLDRARKEHTEAMATAEASAAKGAAREHEVALRSEVQKQIDAHAAEKTTLEVERDERTAAWRAERKAITSAWQTRLEEQAASHEGELYLLKHHMTNKQQEMTRELELSNAELAKRERVEIVNAQQTVELERVADELSTLQIAYAALEDDLSEERQSNAAQRDIDRANADRLEAAAAAYLVRLRSFKERAQALVTQHEEETLRLATAREDVHALRSELERTQRESAVAARRIEADAQLNRTAALRMLRELAQRTFDSLELDEVGALRPAQTDRLRADSRFAALAKVEFGGDESVSREVWLANIEAEAAPTDDTSAEEGVAVVRRLLYDLIAEMRRARVSDHESLQRRFLRSSSEVEALRSESEALIEESRASKQVADAAVNRNSDFVAKANDLEQKLERALRDLEEQKVKTALSADVRDQVVDEHAQLTAKLKTAATIAEALKRANAGLEERLEERRSELKREKEGTTKAATLASEAKDRFTITIDTLRTEANEARSAHNGDLARLAERDIEVESLKQMLETATVDLRAVSKQLHDEGLSSEQTKARVAEMHAAEATSLVAKQRELEGRVRELQSALDESKRETTTHESLLVQSRAACAQHESSSVDLKLRNDDLTQRHARAEKQLEKAQISEKTLSKELEVHRSQKHTDVRELEVQLAETAEQLVSVRADAQAEHTLLSMRVEELTAEIAVLSHARTAAEAGRDEIKALKEQDERHIVVLETKLGDLQARSAVFQSKHDEMLEAMQLALNRDSAEYSAALRLHEEQLVDNARAMGLIAQERDDSVAQLKLLREEVTALSKRMDVDEERAETIARLQQQASHLEASKRAAIAEGSQVELRLVETRAQLARVGHECEAHRLQHRSTLLRMVQDAASRAFDAHAAEDAIVVHVLEIEGADVSPKLAAGIKLFHTACTSIDSASDLDRRSWLGFAEERALSADVDIVQTITALVSTLQVLELEGISRRESALKEAEVSMRTALVMERDALSDELAQEKSRLLELNKQRHRLQGEVKVAAEHEHGLRSHIIAVSSELRRVMGEEVAAQRLAAAAAQRAEANDVPSDPYLHEMRDLLEHLGGHVDTIEEGHTLKHEEISTRHDELAEQLAATAKQLTSTEAELARVTEEASGLTRDWTAEKQLHALKDEQYAMDVETAALLLEEARKATKAEAEGRARVRAELNAVADKLNGARSGLNLVRKECDIATKAQEQAVLDHNVAREDYQHSMAESEALYKKHLAQEREANERRKAMHVDELKSHTGRHKEALAELSDHVNRRKAEIEAIAINLLTARGERDSLRAELTKSKQLAEQHAKKHSDFEALHQQTEVLREEAMENVERKCSEAVAEANATKEDMMARMEAAARQHVANTGKLHTMIADLSADHSTALESINAKSTTGVVDTRAKWTARSAAAAATFAALQATDAAERAAQSERATSTIAAYAADLSSKTAELRTKTTQFELQSTALSALQEKKNLMQRMLQTSLPMLKQQLEKSCVTHPSFGCPNSSSPSLTHSLSFLFFSGTRRRSVWSTRKSRLSCALRRRRAI